MERAGSGEPRLDQLRSWLMAGWVIEEPVLQRSIYHGIHGRVTGFEVVVERGGERRVVALRDVPEVQNFMLERGLTVLELG